MQHLSDQVESHLGPKLSLPSQTGLLLRQARLVVNKGTKFNFIAEAGMWEGRPLSALIGREKRRELLTFLCPRACTGMSSLHQKSPT